MHFTLQLVDSIDPEQEAADAKKRQEHALIVACKDALLKAGWIVGGGMTAEQQTSAVRQASQDLRDRKVVPEGMWVTFSDDRMRPGHR